MGDEAKNQPNPERAQAIEAAKNSLDPAKIMADLAANDLNAQQKAESSSLETKNQKKRAAVEAAINNQKADLIVGLPADKQEAASKIANQLTDKLLADQQAAEAAPKSPTTQPASAPAQQSGAAPTTTPSASPPVAPTESATKKDFFTEIKKLFTKLFENSWIGKLFGLGKTETPPPTTPTAPTTQQPTSLENNSHNKESWRPVILAEAERLGIEPAFAEAVINVEAGQKGINPDGSLKIRMEPHVLNSQLKAKGVNQSPGAWGESKLNGRNVDGVSCEPGQANEHACLRRAMEIDKDAALNSISMGLGQIMGFNAKLAGYGSAEEMYNKFSRTGGGEPEQIRGMFRLIEKTPAILAAARAKDFGRFTTAYNGSKPGSSLYSKYTSSMENYYNRAKKSSSNS